MEKLKKPAQFFLFLLMISSFIHRVRSTKDTKPDRFPLLIVADTITAVDRSTGGRGGAATGGGDGGHNGGGAGSTGGVNSDNTGSSSSTSGSGQSNFGATSSDQPSKNDDHRSHRSDAVRSISFLNHFIFAIVGLPFVLLSL